MNNRRLAVVLTLMLALVLPVAVATAASGGKELAGPVNVTVTMTDFKFRLSKPTVPKNRPIVFNVVNKGDAPHDFDVLGQKGTPFIAPGKKMTVRATFKKAGGFRFVCTVPSHVQFGMYGTLRVK